MDKKSINDFLTFLGAAKPPVAAMAYNLAQMKYAGVHFAISGEDAMLRQHFKHRILSGVPGTYVDIGTWTPVYISNTYLFYLLGWRGLGIDANAAMSQAWQEVRPLDTFENVAVGETPGTAYWHRHLRNEGMSFVSIDADSPDIRTLGDYAPSAPIRLERLDQLFSKHFSNQSIQIMSIDIEGAELGALKSNDWERWRPEAILIEAHDFDMMAPRSCQTIAFLLDQGYVLRGKMGENVFLVDGRATPA